MQAPVLVLTCPHKCDISLSASRPTNNLVGTVVGTVVGACLAPGLGNLQVLPRGETVRW